MVCTFFGHRECPEQIRPRLMTLLEDLIRNQQADLFYVGNQGQFDALVRGVLQELQQRHPHIRYGVVLAYLPREGYSGEMCGDTMLPEGLESVHPRFAISRRNDWMLRRADCVVAYITHSWGGAAKYVQKAHRQGKQVFNLAL